MKAFSFEDYADPVLEEEFEPVGLTIIGGVPKINWHTDDTGRVHMVGAKKYEELPYDSRSASVRRRARVCETLDCRGMLGAQPLKEYRNESDQHDQGPLPG